MCASWTASAIEIQPSTESSAPSGASSPARSEYACANASTIVGRYSATAEPAAVDVEADRRGPADELERHLLRHLAVDQHRDRADLCQRMRMDRVGEAVLDEDRDAVARLDALLEVPRRPALREPVEVEQAELGALATVRVDHRPARRDERSVGPRVHLQGPP